MIYTNDHDPAHVHAHKAGDEVVIELDPIFIRDVIGMSKQDARKAERIVADNQEYLLDRWREIHG